MTSGPDNPRICLVANSFYPGIGGGETHALSLCREWLKRGVPVFVLTRRVTADLKKEEDLDGLTIRRLPPAGFGRFGKYLTMAPTYFELCKRREEYDVIYVCGLRAAGIPAMLASSRLGRPCVLRAESRGELSGGFIWESPDKTIQNSPLKPLIRAYLRRRNRLLLKAAAFVSISGDIRNEFISQGVPESKIRLIHNGVDTSLFVPAGPDLRRQRRKELGLPEGTILLYSGKLNKGKGLEMLLRAWRQLAAELRNCHLVLVGGGGGQFLSCEKDLRDFVRESGLQNRVTFAGFQTGVHRYLQAADFFVFPSESEAFSIALLEALSCELPCVASDISGNTDVVQSGRNGLLLPANNEAAWTDGMRDLLANPARAAAFGAEGRKTVVERFSIAHVAEEHLVFFRSLVSTSGGSAG